MNKITLLIIGCLLTVLVCSLVAYTRGGNESNEVRVLPSIYKSQADAELKDVCYTEVKNGVKEWALNADSASYYENKDTLLLNCLHMVFYGKDDKQVTVIGKRGKLNTNTKDVEIYGEVVVIPDDSYRLKTNSLRYSSGNRSLSTKDMVWIVGQDIVMEGEGLEFHVDTKRVAVLKDVRTVVRGYKPLIRGGGQNQSQGRIDGI